MDKPVKTGFIKPNSNISDTLSDGTKRAILCHSKATQVDILKNAMGSDTVSKDPLTEHLMKRKRVVTGDESEREVIIGHDKIFEAFETSFIQMNLLDPPLRSDLVCQNILIAGLGGLGKTLLLKNVAGNVARLIKKPVSVFNVKSADLVSKYIGDSEKSIQALFNLVVASSPSLLVFDEVDGIMRARQTDEHESTRRFKTSLLAEIRGERILHNVMIIASSNKPWELDENFANRFQKKFLLKLPTPEERTLIFRKFFDQIERSVPIDRANLDYNVLREKSEGFSGYDIKNAVAGGIEKCLRVIHNGHNFKVNQLNEIRSDLESRSKPPKAMVISLDMDTLVSAISNIKPSVAAEEVKSLYLWAHKYIQD